MEQGKNNGCPDDADTGCRGDLTGDHSLKYWWIFGRFKAVPMGAAFFLSLLLTKLMQHVPIFTDLS